MRLSKLFLTNAWVSIKNTAKPFWDEPCGFGGFLWILLADIVFAVLVWGITRGLLMGYSQARQIPVAYFGDAYLWALIYLGICSLIVMATTFLFVKMLYFLHWLFQKIRSRKTA